MKLFLASANPHKVEEFQALVASSGLDLTIISASAAGGMPPVTEDTGTFVGNAQKKARALQARLGQDAWVLADDSGLCVDALGGEPGVESAYYAGPQGDAAANLAKLVEVMRKVPAAERSAHFICVLVVCGPGGVAEVFEGLCRGKLEYAPKGGAGFGYDPLFIPDGCVRTFSELSEEEKNRLSHRGRAWARLAEWVRTQPTGAS